MPNLTDIKYIRDLCDRHDFALSKGFGQNFIVNPGICPRIVEAAGIDDSYGVLEVGPGIGVLTKELAARARKVVAVEVDERLTPLLEETLRRFPALKILGHSQVFWLEISSDVPEDHDGRSSYGRGPVLAGGRLPQLFAQYPNLYGDLSANSAGRAIMRDPEFGLRFLETYADRLFFATDMTHAEAVLPLGAWLDEQAACGKLSRHAYEAICRGNAQRVFGL